MNKTFLRLTNFGIEHTSDLLYSISYFLQIPSLPPRPRLRQPHIRLYYQAKNYGAANQMY